MAQDSSELSFLNIEGMLRSTYFTDEHDVIEELYKPCLENAIEYVRATGYFKSSVFGLMTNSLLDFAIRNGKMTLITSIHVDKNDYEIVMKSLNENILLEELVRMREIEELVPATDMLAALVCNGNLKINIAIRKSGIYHRKEGFFVDGNGNIVLFSGSGNETKTALNPDIHEGSSEAFTVFRNWGEGWAWNSHGVPLYQKLRREIKQGQKSTTPIVSIDKVNPEFFHFMEGVDWLSLENHKELAIQREKDAQLMERREALYEEEYGGSEHQITLRDHQEEAIEVWKNNGHKGILAHSTASGKTITALSCVKEHTTEDCWRDTIPVECAASQ